MSEFCTEGFLPHPKCKKEIWLFCSGFFFPWSSSIVAPTAHPGEAEEGLEMDTMVSANIELGFW
ncbi:hypothetical protein ACQP3F_32110, partial [Escherichia coli]